jgi:predicted amidohydrolase
MGKKFLRGQDMINGFIKVATATPRLRVADSEYNSNEIIALMKEAFKKKVKLLLFPELAITAYTCGDLFFQRTLIEGAEAALAKVIRASEHLDMVTVVGVPIAKDAKLYNTAAVILNGKLLGVVPKTHLPGYNEFYERRQFTPAPDDLDSVTLCGQRCPFGSKLIFACEDFSAFRLGIEICEDLWVPHAPSIGLAIAGATVIANPSASNEIIGKDAYRRQLVLSQSARLVAAYAQASVPKVTVVAGQAIGSGWLMMGSKSCGADMVYAWPEAVIAPLQADTAAVILYDKQIAQADDPIAARAEYTAQYLQQDVSALAAAQAGIVDNIFAPEATRPMVAAALEMLASKREQTMPKKHAVAPV